MSDCELVNMSFLAWVNLVSVLLYLVLMTRLLKYLAGTVNHWSYIKKINPKLTGNGGRWCNKCEFSYGAFVFIFAGLFISWKCVATVHRGWICGPYQCNKRIFLFYRTNVFKAIEHGRINLNSVQNYLICLLLQILF